MPATADRRSVRLRWHLALLVAGVLLPLAGFSVGVTYLLSARERAASERRLSQAARTLAAAVDRETSATVRTLRALAESDALARDDLAGFREEAARVGNTEPTWLTVILLSPDARQLVNTRLPFGEPLPPPAEADSALRVVRTGRPVVGDLAKGRSGEWGVPVRVPVVRDGAVRYVLTAVIAPEALASVLRGQAPTDDEWARTVVDGRGTVVARTRDPERFVGASASPAYLAATASSAAGVFRNTTLDGQPSFVAFDHAPESGWTVAVVVPVEAVEGPGRRATLGATAAGLALLLASLAVAFAFSRALSRSIGRAATAAAALARGEVPAAVPSRIAEVDALGRAIEDSAALLAERGRERDASLGRAEAAREAAEEASRLKDEFAVTASHELRTPLNAILGWSRLLSAGRLDAAGVARATGVIARNAGLLARLVDDLLDVSRVVTGKLRLAFGPVDLAAVVDEAAETARHTADAKGVLVTTSVDPALGSVEGDGDRLRQIVSNLLSNAVKFTPSGGAVTVAASRRGDRVEIVVADTGIGVDAGFLPHLFDRFRQADGSITRDYGGLGVGLSIARHLAEAHGGTLTARSEGRGRGAEFTLSLPTDGAPRDDEGAADSAEPSWRTP